MICQYAYSYDLFGLMAMYIGSSVTSYRCLSAPQMTQRYYNHFIGTSTPGCYFPRIQGEFPVQMLPVILS